MTGDKKKTLQVESKEEIVLLNRELEKKVLRLGMYEYDWSVFLEKINKCITDATHSDDKQLGFWFGKTPKDSNLINIETFVSKVIFYLWTDVFKDFGAKATNPFAFKTAEGGMVVCPFSSFFDPYTVDINLGQIHGFMYNLGIILQFGFTTSKSRHSAIRIILLPQLSKTLSATGTKLLERKRIASDFL